MADESVFAVELVTPERVLLSGAATEVTLRTGEGDLSFLAGHTPLVGTIKPGVVGVVRPDEDEVRVASHGGFVQVEQGLDTDDGSSGTRVTLLFGVAELAEEIDVARAECGPRRRPRPVCRSSGARAAIRRGPARMARRRPTPSGWRPKPALLRAQVRLEAVDAAAGAPAT